jgi:ribosomal-protein-alanine N-acetyltransferase
MSQKAAATDRVERLRIRPMRSQDVSTVAEIDRLSFTLPWSEGAFRYEVNENPTARAWVAEWDGRVVGMLILWLVLDEAHIATLATHPDYRRRGIGARLLATALDAARAEGARRAFLEVRVSNLAAQALYARFGFVVDGRRLCYYRDNGEDALLLSLDMTSLPDERYPLTAEAE